MKPTTRPIFAVLALAAAVLASGCANLNTRDKNTITGAGIGAVTGAVLTGGSGIGTVGGAAVGGYIGSQVRK